MVTVDDELLDGRVAATHLKTSEDCSQMGGTQAAIEHDQVFQLSLLGDKWHQESQHLKVFGIPFKPCIIVTKIEVGKRRDWRPRQSRQQLLGVLYRLGRSHELHVFERCSTGDDSLDEVTDCGAGGLRHLLHPPDYKLTKAAALFSQSP